MEKIIITADRQASLNGMMTFGMLENGLHTADFMNCEDAAMEPFKGSFTVLAMRDATCICRSARSASATTHCSSARHGTDGCRARATRAGSSR